MITSGLNKKILVVGAETLSKITDFTDRTTCILFGDGAGALLVEYDENQPSFISSHIGSEGEGGQHLYCTNLATQMNNIDLLGNGCIVQNGREVYKWAIKTVTNGMKAVAEKGRINLDEIDWFVPHSANLRMLESICEKSNFPMEQTLYSLIHYGNTSAATIPLSLDIGVEEGKLKAGDYVLLYGFGGGLAHAGLLIRWTL